MSGCSQRDEGKSDLQLATAEDGSVLFDLEHDRLLKLNPIAVEMWKLFSTGHTEAEIATTISGRYGVEYERVAGDVHQLIGKLAVLRVTPQGSALSQPMPVAPPQENGQPSFPWYGRDASSPQREAKMLTVLFALGGLAAFDLVLTAFSMKWLGACVRRWPSPRRAPAITAQVIGQICAAVDVACVWYPKRAVCLQRSAVTTCLLKSYGIPARLAIGVRPMPFLAHAWVEVEGSVVNDWAGVRRLYQSLVFF